MRFISHRNHAGWHAEIRVCGLSVVLQETYLPTGRTFREHHGHETALAFTKRWVTLNDAELSQ